MANRKIIENANKRTQLLPTTQREWERLLLEAIQRAEINEDFRLQELKLAKVNNIAEKVLRKLSIICIADLEREFIE